MAEAGLNEAESRHIAESKATELTCADVDGLSPLAVFEDRSPVPGAALA